MIDIANTLQKARMLAQAGQYGEADRLFNAVVRAAPGLAQAWHLWGQMLMTAGNTEAAVLGLKKAVDLEAGNPAYLFSLGQVLLKAGRADEAEKCLRKALRKAPDNASVHNELGTILKHLGRTDEARAAYLKAIKHQPDSVDAHYNIALLHYQTGEYDEAIRAYQKALNLAPGAADIHSALGIVLHAVERNDEALTHMDKALSANPGVTDWLLNRAAVLVALGRFEEALEDYRKVTAAQPANATAWKGIAMNKRFTDAADPDIEAIEALLAETAMTTDERIALAFGLGKALDDSKDYDRAFAAFEEANRLQRSQYQYSAVLEKQRFDAVKRCFNREFFAERADYGQTKGDVVPVFILGMPRSGTSLAEQILASHPKVYGCGEIPDLYQIVSGQTPPATDPDFVARVHALSASRIGGIARKYLDRIVHLANGERWISNKLPFNFLHVGWIRLLFPNAKIIHCKRDARDVCLSIYQHGFATMSAFAYDLRELGIYHRLYADLMAHWNDTLPGFIHEIQYEDLIQDQETHTRALLEFCGLDWDPACLAFHESARSVRTASFSQVRKPIYHSSMQRWRRYEAHLGPLLEALERPLDELLNR